MFSTALLCMLLAAGVALGATDSPAGKNREKPKYLAML